MKSVLSLSLLLLVFAAGAHLQRGASTGPTDQILHDTDGTTLRVYSSGTKLPPARFRSRPHPQSIIVDGDLMMGRTFENGLRVARVQGGQRSDFVNFDTGKDPEAAQALLDYVRATPDDTVLAIANFRNAEPGGKDDPERTATMASALEELGAEAQPHLRQGLSWAYLGLRRDGRWIRLAESASDKAGVGIAFHLDDDLSRYDDWRCELRWEDTLQRPLRAAADLEYPAQLRWGYPGGFEVNRVRFEGIYAALPTRKEFGERTEPLTRVRFPYMYVHPGMHLTTSLGVSSYWRTRTDGVEFSVWVGDRLVAARNVAEDPDEPDAWIPWEVDLSAFEREWVGIELRTRSLDEPDGSAYKWRVEAFWGEPTLVYPAPDDPQGDLQIPDGPGGIYERTPPRQRLRIFDQNQDGVIEREETLTRLGLFDKNGDGSISADEVPPIPGFLESLDENGDQRIDRDEARRWYDRMGDPAAWR